MLIYKIPPDSFAAYAKLPAAQVEARADALRFDAILEAAGKYLADGHDLSKISALELKRLDLLPPDWRVNPPPGYTDWQIGPATGGGVGIIIVGSYEGVRPLLERYREIASRARLSRADAMGARFASAHRFRRASARDLRPCPSRGRRAATA